LVVLGGCKDGKGGGCNCTIDAQGSQNQSNQDLADSCVGRCQPGSQPSETKAVRLEQELKEANAQVLEAKRGQLAAVRASKASEAAHKMTLQSKQWDRGKMRVQQ
jgi:hypothetical protein